MPRQVLGEVSEEDLGGLSLDQVKCRACSGYGNCGYRMYRLHDGKPVAICTNLRNELLEKKRKEEDVELDEGNK